MHSPVLQKLKNGCFCKKSFAAGSQGVKNKKTEQSTAESVGLPPELLEHIFRFAKDHQDQKGLVFMSQQTVNLGSLVKTVGPQGIRVLHLNSTDLTKLANLASALHLYPRVKFAVVCNAWVERKQTATWTALQEVFAGTSFSVQSLVHPLPFSNFCNFLCMFCLQSIKSWQGQPARQV